MIFQKDFQNVKIKQLRRVDFPQRDKNIFGKKARFQIGQVTGQILLCLQLFKFLFL